MSGRVEDASFFLFLATIYLSAKFNTQANLLFIKYCTKTHYKPKPVLIWSTQTNTKAGQCSKRLYVSMVLKHYDTPTRIWCVYLDNHSLCIQHQRH